MDIKDFRQLLFINSQYCNYYHENKGIILAGLLKSHGYKYNNEFSKENIDCINKKYRKLTTIINTVVAVELLLYIYLFIFPYFTKIMQLPYIVAVLLMAMIPLVLLYITYIIINKFYENFLIKQFGTFEKTLFKPTIDNIDEKSFEKYFTTKRKSSFVLAILLIIFLSYIFTPIITNYLVSHKNYKSAIKLSSLYLKVVPISPDMYAQRAFSKYKLKDFQGAIKDFKLANEYSLSDDFDIEISAVKLNYLSKEDAMKEFEKLLNSGKSPKTFIKSEKALYLAKHEYYKEAIEVYNEILKKYENNEDVSFNPEKAYYFRAYSYLKLGNKINAQNDLKKSRNLCQDCKFSMETRLIEKP